MTDPITVAVLQNRLNAIAEEMGEAMLRTGYSQILNSSRDFSVALIDAQCRLVAQADHIPVHVGAMPWAAKALMAAFPDPRAQRRLPAERSLSRRLAFARPDRLRAGVRRAAADVLVGGARASFRYRRRHARRLQPRRHRDLARRPAPAADPPHRERRAAPGPAGDAGAERAPSRAISAATSMAQIGAARLGEQRLNWRHRRSSAAPRWRPRSRRCWTPPSATPAISSPPGRTASITARLCWTTTASAPDNIARARHGHQARQRGHRRSDRVRSAGGRLHQFLARQHAVGGGDGVRLPARSRHRQERRRVPPADGDRQGGHHRLGA